MHRLNPGIILFYFADYQTRFFPIIFVVFILLPMFGYTGVLAGCPRAGRCSGIPGLRRDLRQTITALIPTSGHLAGLTARGYRYMVSEALKIVIDKQLSIRFLIY